MPREARVDIAGLHYVTNRSQIGKKIFELEMDKRELLSILCKSCDRYEAKIEAFYLSDSAYHLIVHTSKANLSLLMRQVSSAYSIYYNRKEKKRGSIWRDRFSSWVIKEKNDRMLIHKYIALLPKNEKPEKNPFEYEYSYINTLFSNKEDIPCFEKNVKLKKIEHLLSGKFEDSDLIALRGFKRTANKGIKKESTVEERESLEKIFKKIKTKEKRNKKIKKAFHAGYTQNEIAHFLDLSQSSISKIINGVGRNL